MSGKTKALGLGSGLILDSQLTASSSLSPNHDASNSRLGVENSSFISATNDTSPWIKVDFMKLVYVMGIIISGSVSHYID